MKKKLGPTLEAIKFFHENAGYSYAPEKETPEKGRRRGARLLAQAEIDAREAGYSFSWEPDCMDSSEWLDEDPPYTQWVCIIRDGNGTIRGSLGGVDFGRDRDPWGDPYRRVVEAELAMEESPDFQLIIAA